MDLPTEINSQNNKFKEFIFRRRYLILLVVAVIIIGVGTMSIIAYQQQMSLPVYFQSLSTPQISVTELASGKLKSVVLIDVRSLEEYQEDHIGNSQLVPLSEIEAGEGFAKVQNILQSYEQKHRDKPIVVLYCTSGMRSIKANKLLSDRGYQPLTLTGGITAWREKIRRSQDLNALKFQ
ncbi:MAG: rhodanese-like domain-containing protein [Pseudanabaena sp. ELA645]|jgi:rhodanese-related sulfurtransferase